MNGPTTPRGKPFSIALRLTLLFSVVTMLTFAAVGTYLFQVLVRKIEIRDDAVLIDKVMLVRHILNEESSPSALEHALLPFKNALYGREGFELRLVGPDGQLFLQIAGSSQARPVIAAHEVPLARAPTLNDIDDWRSASDDGRVLTAVGKLGDAAGTPVQIAVSRQRSGHSAFLQEYLINLSCAIGIGAAMVAAFGFLIVRHGMQPLRHVIGQANLISTNRLNARLSVEHGPTELRALGAAFNAMLDRLEEGVQRLSRFAADLAHDMRTPISTLMVASQVALSRPRSNDEYQALVASNIEEYEHLSRMIENTLFLARVDNAQLAMAREALDARVELQRMRNYFEGLADDAGVTLSITTPQSDDTATTLDADPVLLRRALGNLVSNAISHTPRDGAVTLSAHAEPGGTRIDIANTGPGISAEHLPHIFDRYYRADAARTSGSSSGLGLSIVQAIMQLHGGDVSARSVPGETIFSLRFAA